MSAAAPDPLPAALPDPPGPPLSFFLRNNAVYSRNPLGYWLDWRRQLGDVIGIGFGPLRFALVFHPAAIEKVLRNSRDFPREGHPIDVLAMVQGKGIATVDGEEWRRQRRMLQPIFHQRKVDGYAPLMLDAIRGFLARWEASADGDAPLDVGQEMIRIATRIGTRTMMSADVADEWLDGLERTMAVIFDETIRRVQNPFAPPMWLPTPHNRRFKRALEDLDQLVYPILEERRAREVDREDLLRRLMDAADEDTGEQMDVHQLRDQVVTLAGAGHDTTALSLVWAWVLLDRNPLVREQLEAEVDAVLPDRDPTPEDIEHLPTVRRILAEVLRLYPPVYAMIRRARKDCELGGVRVRAGTYVVVSQYVAHRHPDFWDDPEAFRPDRFEPDGTIDRPDGAYFPFGLGPHVCIGKPFALLDTALILVCIARRYRLELAPGAAVDVRPGLTLRPDGPVPMTVRRRAGAGS